jgi:hypothetical protein
MEYISLDCWYDIPELVVPIRISLRELLLTRKLLNQGFLFVKLMLSLRKFYGRHHDLIGRYRICVTNDHEYATLVVNTSLSFPRCSWHYWICNKINTTGVTSGAGTAHPSEASVFTPIFGEVRVTRSLVWYVCFVDRCLSFCPFSFDPMCCMFFFDKWILITLLVSSSSSIKKSR